MFAYFDDKEGIRLAFLDKNSAFSPPNIQTLLQGTRSVILKLCRITSNKEVWDSFQPQKC